MKKHGLWIFFLLQITVAFGSEDKSPFEICPDSPNCVNSISAQMKHDKDRYIEPLDFSGLNMTPEQAFERIKRLMEKQTGFKLVKVSKNYLHFTHTSSLMKFVDDIEVKVDNESKKIHFKSASRTGYWDMGANRSRVEDLKFKFAQSGM